MWAKGLYRTQGTTSPPVTTVGGLGIAADQNQAYQAALTDGVNEGGHQCVVEAVKQSGCAAAASTDFGEMVGGFTALSLSGGPAATAAVATDCQTLLRREHRCER
jgi:hypothetical protein